MTVRVVTTAFSFLALASLPVAAAEHATPEEILAKVREAAAYLSENGEAGLPMFSEAQSAFVWKDTYVFVLDCADDITAAHPVKANIGRPVSALKDVDGKPFGDLMCEAAASPDGGWVEYMWPKTEAGADGTLVEADTPSRKIAYVMSVPDQPYQVGAGDYDDNLTVPELEKLLAE